MNRVRAPLLTAILFSACCSTNPERLRWELLQPLPDGAQVERTEVVLPVGTTVAVRPVVEGDDGEVDCTPTIDSGDPDVLRVEEAARGAFALEAQSAGETTLVVECGPDRFEIPTRVTE